MLMRYSAAAAYFPKPPFHSTNQLSGPIPAELGPAWQSMIALNMGNNSFTGQLPASFSQMKKLRDLRLYMNKFEGNIPKEWTVLSSLEVLQIQ
jgi:hypothetical protein